MRSPAAIMSRSDSVKAMADAKLPFSDMLEALLTALPTNRHAKGLRPLQASGRAVADVRDRMVRASGFHADDAARLVDRATPSSAI